jgi:hypothetical protein
VGVGYFSCGVCFWVVLLWVVGVGLVGGVGVVGGVVVLGLWGLGVVLWGVGVLLVVGVGFDMGQNFGVVVGITDTDIKLKELMQDGAGDWSERSSTLNLLSADQKQEQKK